MCTFVNICVDVETYIVVNVCVFVCEWGKFEFNYEREYVYGNMYIFVDAFLCV